MRPGVVVAGADADLRTCSRRRRIDPRPCGVCTIFERPPFGAVVEGFLDERGFHGIDNVMEDRRVLRSVDEAFL